MRAWVGGGVGVVVQAYLDEVLALGLGDKWLQLGCGEGVDEARLGDNEQQDLGAGEDRQLVGLDVLASVNNATATRTGRGQYLFHDSSLALGEGDVATRLVCDELDLNLAALAAGLVVVVVLVVGSGAWALCAAVGIADIELAVAGAVVVDRGRRVLVVVGDFRGHVGGIRSWSRECLADRQP